MALRSVPKTSLAVTVGFAVAGLFVAVGDAASRPNPIVVSDQACAPGWKAPPAGRTTFTVTNTSKQTTFGVDLIGSDHVSVYGEIEKLAPGTSDTIDAQLGAGTYSFECESFSGGEQYSAPLLVSGTSTSPARSFMPVTPAALVIATGRYRARVAPTLRLLRSDTDLLTRAIKLRRLDEARKLWLQAHLDYERLGAVYGTFGQLDTEINGRPSGLPHGVHDPHWTGFLRLEYTLWNTPHAAGALLRQATALDVDVHHLVRRFPHLQTPSTDLALRTHEILENTLELVLTGQTDMGSHTSLATAWANVEGTQTTLSALADTLRTTNPALVSAAHRGLTRLAGTLLNQRRANGSWRPLQSLTRQQRERIDGETGALLEQLARIPDLLEQPRRPPAGDDERDD